MTIAYLVTLVDFNDEEEDPLFVQDAIEDAVKDLGYQHVDVSMRTQHHVHNPED
jgi:hypothetical protein